MKKSQKQRKKYYLRQDEDGMIYASTSYYPGCIEVGYSSFNEVILSYAKIWKIYNEQYNLRKHENSK